MCVCVRSFRLKSLGMLRCVLMRTSTCVYIMCVLITKIVSCVLVSRFVRLARSISGQAKVKAPWRGVSSEGEFIITVLYCV